MTKITNEIVRIMELRRLGKATSTDIDRLEMLKAEFGRSLALIATVPDPLKTDNATRWLNSELQPPK